VTTTLDIANDVLAEAERRARAKGTSTGEELSDLARRGLQQAQEELDPAKWTWKNGVPVLRSRGVVVTDEDIQRIRDAENI
jgi:hypothetical protein